MTIAWIKYLLQFTIHIKVAGREVMYVYPTIPSPALHTPTHSHTLTLTRTHSHSLTLTHTHSLTNTHTRTDEAHLS